MKKCKRLTAALLAVALTVTSLPSVTAEGFISTADVMKAAAAVAEVKAGGESPAEDFEYKVNEDGCITITGYSGRGGDVVIPGEIEGKKVTVIGYWQSSDCTSITSVEIPDSVTMIGDWAFTNCPSLTSINVDEKNADYSSVDGVLFNKNKTTLIHYPMGKASENYSIPKSVTVIGSGAFGYNFLTSVEIPNSVTVIGSYNFEGCTSLTSVEIPDSVTVIGDYAFYSCTSLTSVEISDSVTEIGSDAFRSCTSLTSVEIPYSVIKIGVGAFSSCASLSSINVDEKNTAYSSVDGVLFNKDKTTLVLYPAGRDKNYLIPKSATKIGYGAFYGCTSLISVEIPDSVTEIGGQAFSHCTSLTSVEIPDSVTEIRDYTFPACTSLTSVKISGSVTVIGYGVFLGCTSLTSIDVDENNTVYSSADGVLFNKDKTTLVLYPAGRDKNYSIPKSVTEIGDSAFLYCTSLASVEISDSVTEIGNRAFDNCTSLTSVKIPSSVTDIGYNIFYKCPNLTIYGCTDSYAEEYANRNGVPFVSIDDSTKIQIDKGIVVTVPENSEATLEGKTLEVESASSDENSAAFNITLRDEEGNEVQPGGEVSVKIPVPAHLDGEKCNVYRKEADGTYTELKSTYENGCLIFITDHFSEYVISAVKPVSIQLGNLNGDDKVSTVDAKWVLQAISGSRTLTEEQKAAADVNKDGKITTVDAKWILQSVSGSRDLE